MEQKKVRLSNSIRAMFVYSQLISLHADRLRVEWPPHNEMKSDLLKVVNLSDKVTELMKVIINRMAKATSSEIINAVFDDMLSERVTLIDQLQQVAWYCEIDLLKEEIGKYEQLLNHGTTTTTEA